MVESSKLTSKGQLLVPKRLRIKYGIKPGIRIALVESKDGLLIKPMDEAYFDKFVGILPNAPSAKEIKKFKKEELALEERKLKLHK